jgi:hypothetical protein
VLSEPSAPAATAEPAGRRLLQTCGYWRTENPVGLDRCRRCSRPLAGGSAEELADLRATLRQISRFRADGSLPPAECDFLDDVVTARIAQLTAPPAVVATAPEPRPSLSKAVEVVFVDEPARPAPPAAPPVPLPPPALTVPPPAVVVPPRPAAPAPPPPPPPPAPPRRPFAEVLAAFMEEHSIRWGEVVGGLLIVGCSIALVISLRDRLESLPAYQFLLFSGVTAGLFGIGLYSLRWKLAATSHGLLIISSLLVPLNLAAMAGMSREQTGPAEAGVVLGSVALLAFLTHRAARSLVPQAPGWTTLAVVAPAGSLLVSGRLELPDAVLAWGAAALPAMLHALAVGSAAAGSAAAGSARRRAMSADEAGGLFTLTALSVFSTGAALCLPLGRADDLPAALAAAAPAITLIGYPVLAVGLLVRRRLPADDAHSARRTAATVVALLGAGLMAAAQVAAWPHPAPVAVTGLIGFAVLSATALRARLPWLQPAAMPGLIAAWLAGTHLLAGRPVPDAAAMFSAWSAGSLLLLAALLAAAAELLVRLGRRPHAAGWALGAAAAGAMSLWPAAGAPDSGPATAAMVSAVLGAIALAANLRWQQPLATHAGLALLTAAALWTLHDRVPEPGPLWGTVSAAAALLFGVAGLIARRPEPLPTGPAPVPDEPSAVARPSAFAEPALRTADVLAVLAAVAAAWAAFGAPAAGRWSAANAATGVLLTALYAAAVWRLRERSAIGSLGRFAIAGAAALGGWIVRPAGPGPAAESIALALAVVSVGLAGGAAGAGFAVLTWRRWATVAGMAAGVALLTAGAPAPTAAAGPAALALTASAMLLTLAYRSLVPTLIGSLTGLSAIWLIAQRVLGRPILDFDVGFVLLAHATVAAAAGIWLGRKSDPGAPAELWYARPLGWSGLATSVCAAARLAGCADDSPGLLSVGLFWLAGLWAAVSVALRHPLLFGAFQIALYAAVWTAALWWTGPDPSADPAELRVRAARLLGMSLAGLGLFWVAVRAWVGRRLSDAPPAEPPVSGAAPPPVRPASLAADLAGLLAPGWPQPHRWVADGLAPAIAVAAIWAAAPGVLAEWSQPRPWAVPASALGPGAWALLGLTALSVAAELRLMRTTRPLLHLMTLVLAAVVLFAAEQAPAAASAVAMRWGLALALAGMSAMVWFPAGIARLAGRLGLAVRDRGARASARRLLSATALPAVLLLTVVPVGRLVLGLNILPPIEGSLFDGLGPDLSRLVPLGLVAVALTGHGVRFGLPGYVFGAGLVLQLMTVGDQAPAAAPDGFDGAAAVRLAQTWALTAAAWAVVWFLLRPAALSAAGLTQRASSAPPLIVAQIAMPAAATGVVLSAAAWSMAASAPAPSPWAAEAGSLLGWLAALATAAALRAYRQMRQSA